uniref:BTB domain-containing protein n=1 Tax=Panagrellus redivivus TaxID=6233 RepID=A0A7E4W9L4_PANRE
MNNVKTTLEDSVSLSIYKNWNVRGMNIFSYRHTESRVFPGCDKYQWTFSYSPARDAFSDELEKNHIRLSLNFIPAVEGRVTIGAKGLPTKTYTFPKFRNFDWLYIDHNELLAAIDDVLELKCTVEIDVDLTNQDVELFDQKYTVHKFPTENCVEFGSSRFKVQSRQENKENSTDINENALDFEAKIERDVVSDSSSVDEPSSSASMRMQKPVKPLIDEIFIPLRKSLRYENQFWNPITTKGSMKNYPWSVTYNDDETQVHTVGLIVEFALGKGVREVDAKLVVGAKGLPTMTYPITKSGKFTFDHLPYNDVYNAIVDKKLDLSCTLVIDGNSIKKFQTKFHEYDKYPNDLVICCGDDRYEIHKTTLRKISPVFEAMLQNSYATKSNNELEIHDFNFKTVETVLNTCLCRPCGEISVELAVDVLRFVEKYVIKSVFEKFEEVIERNLSIDNFFEVLRCAYDCTRKDLFETCAAFYKKNKDVLKNTETFAALPGPLVAKLLKSAYKFEFELDIFLYARENKIRLDMVHMEVTTVSDFFRTVPFAWQYYDDTLKLKCAKFLNENKDIIEKKREYQRYPSEIKDSLNGLACCFGFYKLSV